MSTPPVSVDLISLPLAGTAAADTATTRLLADLVARLRAGSPLAAWLLDQAAATGTRLIADPTSDLLGSYDHSGNNILLQLPARPDGRLSATPDLDTLALTLAHELRHVFQYKALDNIGDPRHYGPADSLHLWRVTEADAEAHAAVVAAELAAGGWPGPAQKAQDEGVFADVHKAAGAAIASDPLAARDGRALAAGFSAWMNDARLCNRYVLPLLDWWKNVSPASLNGFRRRTADSATLRPLGISRGVADYPAMGGIDSLAARAWPRTLDPEDEAQLKQEDRRHARPLGPRL